MQIIRDTREQLKWDFQFYDDVNVIEEKLDFGDYTRADLVGKVVFERKRNTGELYVNLASTKQKERLYREIEVIKNYDLAEVVCEFPEYHLKEFPHCSGIPRSKWPKLKIGMRYFVKLVKELEDHIRVVYCPSPEDAERYVYNRLKKYGK
jgi:hypothetical protein